MINAHQGKTSSFLCNPANEEMRSQSAPSLYFTLDSAAKIVAVNPAGAALLGEEPAQLIETAIADWVLAADQPQLRQLLRSEPDHPSAPIILNLLQRDGSLLATQAQVQWLQGPAGTWLLICQPIQAETPLAQTAWQQLVQSFRSLQENEAQVQLIAEHLHQVLWVISPDGQRHYYISPAYETIWGRSCQSLYDSSASWAETIHADDRDRVLAACQARVQNPQTGLDEEFRIVRPDGTIRWIWGRDFSVFDAQGQLSRIVGIAEDITERKQTDEALRQQTERERLLGAIARQMWQSLELDAILKTTADKVRACLQADRVLVHQFNQDWSGITIIESVAPAWPSVIGTMIQDTCFTTGYVQAYEQGRIQVVEDIYAADLKDCHISLLAQYQIRANLLVPILVGKRLWGLLAAHQCGRPRQWQSWEVELLRQIAIQAGVAIQQSQLYEQTKRQAQRESILNQITEEIRQSLDLEIVLQRAAKAVRSAFQASRCVIGFRSPSQDSIDYRTVALAEGVAAPQIQQIPIPGKPYLESVLSQAIPISIRDVKSSGLTLPVLELLTMQSVRALLLVSIHLDGQSIGVLVLHQCDRPRVWTEDEELLIKAVADQLAIAIQQAQLYQQVQELNTNLEQQVQEQTLQLRQALDLEATLKQITDKVRDSLDETQILETVVQALGVALKVDACNTGIYSPDLTYSTITHEYTHTLPPAKGLRFQFTDFLEVYNQLKQGASVEFCWTESLSARPIPGRVSVLACPMLDNQGVLGDLWLFKATGATFEDVEIRLVQQVANQCAIALRQARLYQAVQAQVNEYERLHRLKDDFLSTVSHELRTPMTNIRMATQMLEVVLQQPHQEGVTSQRTARYFQILRDECHRELQLINDLLDLSRLDAETKPLNLTTIDLKTWLPSVVQPFRERAQNQQQTLGLDLAPDLLPLTTDLAALERICLELLNNACKYTPAHEQIRVMAAMTDQGLCLSVCNSGVAIAPDEQARIFDKFYRVPHHDPWKYGGTGLGLALVKRLTEHIGATVQVHSAAAETCFVLQFPSAAIAP